MKRIINTAGLGSKAIIIRTGSSVIVGTIQDFRRRYNERIRRAGRHMDYLKASLA